MDETDYTRLHITPFNAALLRTIIPPSILPNARNISYHEIQTWPEKAYGYIELPIMDAEKIKKKLNGTTLKGTKVRIEKAREETTTVVENQPVPPQRERKQKRQRNELPGVDIGERRVKRGWTTPAKDVKKDQTAVKSKFTTIPECLFKTNLPPNVASQVKTAKNKPEKRKKIQGKEVIVHEFAKTTKYATFLRSRVGLDTNKPVAQFVDGKGWVDAEGNIVEEFSFEESRKSKPVPLEESSTFGQDDVEIKAPANHTEVDSNANKESSYDTDLINEREEQRSSAAGMEITLQAGAEISSDSSSSDEEEACSALANHVEQHDTVPAEDSSDDSSDGESDYKIASSSTPRVTKKFPLDASSPGGESSDEEPMAEAQVSREEFSSSPDSSEAGSDSYFSDSSGADAESEEPHSAITIKSPISTIPALSIRIPGSLSSTPIASSVHPLEALYKRSEPNASNLHKATEPSFSFFGADVDDEDTVAEPRLQVPLTTFTQKDVEYRGLRSAAPTPDTAHVNRKFVWPSQNRQEDNEAVDSSPTRKGEVKAKEKTTEPESDFQKWFYENRGDVRRAWTGRRKSAAKAKRQQENRNRGRRAI